MIHRSECCFNIARRLAVYKTKQYLSKTGLGINPLVDNSIVATSVSTPCWLPDDTVQFDEDSKSLKTTTPS